MTGWDDPVIIATIVGAVAGGASGGAVSVIYDVRKSRLVVELERFDEKLSPPRSPCETIYSIRVKSSKTLEHCKVFVSNNSMPIPAARGGPTPLETKISAGGSQNFRIPTSINPWGDGDGQLVVVKNNDKTVKKQSFRKIPLDVTQSVAQVDMADPPRIRDLIQKVLTPLIENLEGNNQQGIRHYLEEEVLLYERVPEGGMGSAAGLTYESFKASYPELASKLKAYDEQNIGLQHLREKLFQVLVQSVNRIVPSILKEGIIPAEWNTGKPGFPSVDAYQLVRDGIFAVLRQKPVSVTGLQGFLWVKSEMFMALTEETDAKRLIGEMKKLAQKCYDDGVALKQELSQLRDSLGSKYKIPMEDYFVGNPLEK